MRTRIAALLAAGSLSVTLAIAPAGADTQLPASLCSGDPELPGVNFICGAVSVRVVADADAEAVIARSAPSATFVRLDATGTWLLRVPSGEEVAVRDALRHDPAVEYVSLTYIGVPTGVDGLPDVALTPYRLPLSTIIGLVALIAALLVAAVGELRRVS
jgi:hypothetical protein